MGRTNIRLNRIAELDLLRALAIFLIVIGHIIQITPFFMDKPWLQTVRVFILTTGLSTFFFISGYSLVLKRPHFDRLEDFGRYIKKRFLRIYPLYWASLILTTILFGVGVKVEFFFSLLDFNVVQQMTTISGFQVILYPAVVPYLGALWYVSVIVLLYLLFPIIICISEKIDGGSLKSIILISSIIFIIISLFCAATGCLAVDQVFIFYWIFIAGIVIGRSFDIKDIHHSSILKIIVVAGAGLGLLYVIDMGMDSFKLLQLNIVTITKQALVGAIGLSLAILGVKKISPKIRGAPLGLVGIIGRETYIIYLFHLIILSAFLQLSSGYSQLASALIMMLIALPCAVAVPIHLDKLFGHSLDVVQKMVRCNRDSLNIFKLSIAPLKHKHAHKKS